MLTRNIVQAFPRLALAAILAGPAAHAAHAGVLNLTAPIGGANVYAIRDFSSTGSDTEGAIVAGGNVTLSGYRVNDRDVGAFGGYAVVAGGKVSIGNGNIVNGQTYAAGGTQVAQNATIAGSTTTNPIDFGAAERYYKMLSAALDGVAGTGSVGTQWGGVKVKGSGKGGVDVFDMSSDLLMGSTWWQLEDLVPGQTLVFNVSGAAGSFNNGNMGMDALSGYNVLFNFYEATTVDVRGLVGSILAPYATVNASGGVVNGTVIVDSWNAQTQINANHYFNTVELAGLDLKPDSDKAGGAVPEPGSIALMLGGLALLGYTRRRK